MKKCNLKCMWACQELKPNMSLSRKVLVNIGSSYTMLTSNYISTFQCSSPCCPTKLPVCTQLLHLNVPGNLGQPTTTESHPE